MCTFSETLHCKTHKAVPDLQRPHLAPFFWHWYSMLDPKGEHEDREKMCLPLVPPEGIRKILDDWVTYPLCFI